MVVADGHPGCCTQVDVADFSGPVFKSVDNRFAALTLVQKNLCDAALFSPSGALSIALCKHAAMLCYSHLIVSVLAGLCATFPSHPRDADSKLRKRL